MHHVVNKVIQLKIILLHLGSNLQLVVFLKIYFSLLSEFVDIIVT